MIYFVLLWIPLLMGPCRSLPNGKMLYRYFVVCFFIVLILFSGLRWSTGTDWVAYRQYFQDQNNSFLAFEVGYVWLTGAVKEFTNSYTVFLLVDSVLALAPIWYVLQVENEGDPVSLAVFFSYYYTINYLGSNRRIISIGLCFLALLALKKGQRWFFIALCLISFCFHRSSLIFLLAWPIYHLKPSKKMYLLLLLIAVAFLILNPFQYLLAHWGGATGIVMIDKVVGYSDNNALDPNINYGLQNTISIIKRLVFLVLIWWGWSKQSYEKKDEYAGFLNMYVFSFAFYLMFTGTVELLKSLTLYFSIVELLLLPLALFCIEKKFRPIAYFLFICVLFGQQYSALHSFWDLYVPYKSIVWEGVR
jgi:EpsG family